MPFGRLAYEERSQNECYQNKSPKSYSVTSTVPRPDVHTVSSAAVWCLKGSQSGKKLAEAEAAEIILTLCHRSSLLHILELCKVNRCSFKGSEIRVTSTKQIWSEQLSLVDLQVKVLYKSAETFSLSTNTESRCYGSFRWELSNLRDLRLTICMK